MLARVAAAMPELLKGETSQCGGATGSHGDPRAGRLVEARTKLWCSLRGLAKSLGHRLPRRVKAEGLRELRILEPLWKALEDVSQRIQEHDQQIAELEKEVSGGGAAAADRWRGATDLADIRADAGRPQAIPQEPANRQLPGTAAQTAGFGGVATAVADQERGTGTGAVC